MNQRSGTTLGTQPFPANVPRCATCGALITGHHDCVRMFGRTVANPGGFYLTPWGTWAWRPW